MTPNNPVDPKTKYTKKAGKKLFIVNGVDEIQLHDGTKFRMNPDPKGQLEVREILELLHNRGWGIDEAEEKLNQVIQAARIEELKGLLHNDACEFICGWSKKCDVQGEICPKIRKRLAALEKA